MRLPLLGLLLVIILQFSTSSAPLGSISVKIVNHAGRPIELYWHDNFSRKKTSEPILVKQTEKPIKNNSEANINSYNTHEFVARFVDHIDGVEVYFTKGPLEETVTVKYDDENDQLYVIQKTVLDELRDTISESTKDCNQLDGDAYANCVASGVKKEISKITDSQQLMKKYRDHSSKRLRDYICQDNTLRTHKGISNTSYTDYYDYEYAIHDIIETSHTNIWLVHDFVNEEECNVLKSYHTSITQGNPYYVDQNIRKLPLNDNLPQLLRNLHNRIQVGYMYKNFTVISLDGHEDIYTVLYKEGDELPSQCDGACNGQMMYPGARYGTVLLHCEVPEKGGMTVFPKSDVYVRPEKYDATFILYASKYGYFDDGYSERSECPVVKGNKFQPIIHLRKDVNNQFNWKHYEELHIRDVAAQHSSGGNDGIYVDTMSAGIGYDGSIDEL